MIKDLEKLIKALEDQEILFIEQIEFERRISENRQDILELIKKIQND